MGRSKGVANVAPDISPEMVAPDISPEMVDAGLAVFNEWERADDWDILGMIKRLFVAMDQARA